MPRCPNCGKETARTEDWACQWCGYPLLSRAYKKIPKTYQQLQAGRLAGQESPLTEEPEPEPTPELELEFELPPAPKQKSAPVFKTEPTPEPEPVLETEPEATAKTESEAISASEPEPEPVAEVIAEPAVVSEPVPVPDLKPEPTTGIISLTVAELNSAYHADKLDAHEKLVGKTLRITGMVEKAVVKDYLGIQYVLLTGATRPEGWNVRCTFAREHGPRLMRLTPGQTVTVEGKYAGYGRNIILENCVLAQ